MYLEIYGKFKYPNIVTLVKVCRWECLGRVVRMNGYWKANKEKGANENRRTKLKWMDNAAPGLRNVGIK